MAETRITKLQVRRGDIADLPLLDEGELGYATDEQRLFIGNILLSLGTGTGAQVIFDIPVNNQFPVSDTDVSKPTVYVDDVEDAGVTLINNDTQVQFAVAPANLTVITMKANGELALINRAEKPGSLSLAASQPPGTSTGFVVNTSVYDVIIMDYSIFLGAGTAIRVGQLRIGVDNANNTLVIDDQHNTLTSTVDITFSGTVAADELDLTYENLETEAATFKYTYKLWKM